MAAFSRTDPSIYTRRCNTNSYNSRTWRFSRDSFWLRLKVWLVHGSMRCSVSGSDCRWSLILFARDTTLRLSHLAWSPPLVLQDLDSLSGSESDQPFDGSQRRKTELFFFVWWVYYIFWFVFVSVLFCRVYIEGIKSSIRLWIFYLLYTLIFPILIKQFGLIYTFFCLKNLTLFFLFEQLNSFFFFWQRLIYTFKRFENYIYVITVVKKKLMSLLSDYRIYDISRIINLKPFFFTQKNHFLICSNILK